MNLFFGGPPEESLKRQVGEKASGPDVSEKQEASITGSTDRILQHSRRSSETLYNRTLYQDHTEGST